MPSSLDIGLSAVAKAAGVSRCCSRTCQASDVEARTLGGRGAILRFPVCGRWALCVGRESRHEAIVTVVQPAGQGERRVWRSREVTEGVQGQ